MIEIGCRLNLKFLQHTQKLMHLSHDMARYHKIKKKIVFIKRYSKINWFCIKFYKYFMMKWQSFAFENRKLYRQICTHYSIITKLKSERGKSFDIVRWSITCKKFSFFFVFFPINIIHIIVDTHLRWHTHHNLWAEITLIRNQLNVR